MLAISVFQANAEILETKGWLETLYVKWNKEACAAKYNVYYQVAGASSWTKIDDPLIREYSDHFRADVLGLKAGSYNVRVVLVNGGSEGAEMTVSNIQVLAHDRSGFAFLGGVVPGAYNADGTLKPNAQIIYITDQNKESVSFTVKTASNATTAATGLLAIVKGIEKGYEDRPLVFRFIGKVTEKDLTLDGGDIAVKGSSNPTATVYVTFEGVGDDAVLYGLGFKTSRARNLEIRNLGFMLTNSDEGDNIGLNTDSRNVWIHNNDMFYGNEGSDADQVKGDGATDAKASTDITIAYNRYWDNGKTHLLGNSSSETPGNITVHHNWYDHSDSRHPRVRKHYVHVYNNYYSGVSTYGIGAVMASSIFAEKNYFSTTNRPMMISMQGTDIENGSGTFSKEDGGMIKAFNNFMDASSKTNYKPYSNSNTVEFDAYEVTSATQTVPSNVTAKQGGSTFNNSIIPSGYSYTTENDSAAVRTKVTTYAGRYYGGDFKYTITASNSSVDATLKSQLQSYASGLVKIQETGNGGSVSCPTTSSSSSAPSSSSSEEVTPIAHYPLVTHSEIPKYYTIKGEPVGSTKPAKPGVYLVKQGNSVHKIVVR
jgi:pectate lyase